MSITRIDKIADYQIDNIIDKKIENMPFSPLDLGSLELWLNADFGVASAASKNEMDFLSDVILTDFPIINLGEYNEEMEGIYIDVNTIYERIGEQYTADVDNASSTTLYYGELYGNMSWILEIVWLDQFESDNFIYFVAVAGQYYFPWEAPWYDGIVTRAPFVPEIPATINNQTIEKWTNIVPNKPSLYQFGTNNKPIYKILTGGKAVHFNSADKFMNSSSLYNMFAFANFRREYSYYIVCKFNSLNSGTLLSLGVGGNPSPLSPQGGIFSSWNSFLNFRNSTTTTGKSTSMRPVTSDYAAILSVRVNLSINQAILGKNLESQSITETNQSFPSTNDISLGSAGAIAYLGLQNVDIFEVLVYNTFHNNFTAKKVIEYLASKRNIRMFN
jgi:hypothetical protein